MKRILRLCGLCALLLWLGMPAVLAQLAPPKVARIDIKHVGRSAVNDELIRANIRIKPGDVYRPGMTDDDVANLYGTGLFYDIRVTADKQPDGSMVLTYVVQDKPTLTDIKFQGNKKYNDAKLLKKISSKVGQPLDEQKLFSDRQTIEEMYQKAGYPGTTAEYVVNIDPYSGRGTATFDIKESLKVKIVRVEFIGAQAFPPSKLRKQIKTRKRWMFSWLTGSGVYKEEQFQDDQEKLKEFYRDGGYIDFEIKDIKIVHPTPRTMIIQFYIYEGRQYKVGAVTFQGTTLFPTNQVDKLFKLRPGQVFKPKDLTKDIEAVEDYYGARGYIDVTANSGNLRVRRVPNVDTGTMDLHYQVDEGQKYAIEKIEIRGNTKTKDKVIRRELAVAPGETFDMVRVKVTKTRLENLQFFEKVDARPEATDPPIAGRKNLVIGVDEKNTGNLTFGAGFSSVDAVVGYAEVSQGNFDLFHPPTFTGGGQKFRLRVQIGTERQDYVMTFVEPWFLGRKLALGTELYYRELDFQSPDNIYNETRLGARVSLTRALGSDFLIGSLSYTIEQVGIHLNGGYHGKEYLGVPGAVSPGGDRTSPGSSPTPMVIPANVPDAILEQAGYSWLSRLGGSLAYDTRNSTFLPDAGQRTALNAEVVGGPLGGDQEFYKIQLDSAWYFRGLAKGHVLELVGRGGVADTWTSSDVPFYERYYLGGLDSLRGFDYRSVSPRQSGFSEPIGGDTYWYGTAEYSIPVISKEFGQHGGVGVRLAAFYDIGNVIAAPYSLSGSYSDDYGIGLRLNLPIGPLRLDYAIPIHHDQYNSSSGKFQFGVGYRREY